MNFQQESKRVRQVLKRPLWLNVENGMEAAKVETERAESGGSSVWEAEGSGL